MWRDYRHAEEVYTSRTRQRGRLVLVDAAESHHHSAGQVFPLLPLTTIGRAATNTIYLNEPVVSNEHALIEWRDGQWWLEDLNSSNGTKLNDMRLEEPTVISSGDEFSVGRIRFRIELD